MCGVSFFQALSFSSLLSWCVFSQISVVHSIFWLQCFACCLSECLGMCLHTNDTNDTNDSGDGERHQQQKCNPWCAFWSSYMYVYMRALSQSFLNFSVHPFVYSSSSSSSFFLLLHTSSLVPLSLCPFAIRSSLASLCSHAWPYRPQLCPLQSPGQGSSSCCGRWATIRHHDEECPCSFSARISGGVGEYMTPMPSMETNLRTSFFFSFFFHDRRSRRVVRSHLPPFLSLSSLAIFVPFVGHPTSFCSVSWPLFFLLWSVFFGI